MSNLNLSEETSDNSELNDVEMCEEEKIIHTICETEECSDVAIVDLEQLCKLGGLSVFDRLKHFVQENDPNDIKYNMDNLFSNLPKITNDISTTSDTKKNIERFEYHLIMKTFKRLKLIEKECIDYKVEYEDYDKYNNMYVTSSDKGNSVHLFNTSNNIDTVDDTEINKVIETIMTPHKKHMELLTYELIFYKPDFKVAFTKNNLKEVSNKIATNISRFNPIFQLLLEDHSWSVNITDTINFSVPKNRIVLSNTIKSTDEEDTNLILHMDKLINYIKRVYKVTSARYIIVPDNKFDFSWVLVTIGYTN